MSVFFGVLLSFVSSPPITKTIDAGWHTTIYPNGTALLIIKALFFSGIIYLLLRLSQKKAVIKHVQPEDLYKTVITDGMIKVEHPKWDMGAVDLKDVHTVLLINTDEGPWLPDIWLTLIDNNGRCLIPQGSDGYEKVYDIISKYDGFNFENAIKSMSCSENKEFLLWQKNPDHSLTKKLLRQQYLAKRVQLSDEECHALNQQLLQQFQLVELSKIHCIHLFLPILERKEPDTYLIRDWLKSTHPHISIVFPQANFETNAMISYADDDALQLADNTYGIPEPVAGNMVDVQEIDLVILPLLAFDKQGYRVGYGKGFYDRFTAQCKPAAQFIGLSFFEPVDSIDDINSYDVWMHACLTPTQKWEWPH